MSQIERYILDNHNKVGLYFSEQFTRMSVSYGIDNPCMEYRGCYAQTSDVVNELKGKQLCLENLADAFKKAAHTSKVVRDHQADFESACDCLYFGYGYNTWEHRHLSDEDAQIIWKRAKLYMANKQ
jgi:hypothetical protein